MAGVLAYLDNLEIGICLRVNRIGRTEWIRRFFAAVSRLGDWGFWVAMAPLLWLLQGNAAASSILHIGLTAAVGVGIYKLLKQRLVRERPFVTDGTILCGAAPLDKYSFPSGHTLHAVSLTIMLSHVEPTLFAVCAPFAVLVALSRVVLGLHYPSDVFVGAAIGAILAQLSITWM
jgi:undecaprenyl-diphosphatase